MRSAFLAVAAAMLIPLRAASSQAIQPKRGDRIRITAAPNALDNRIARVLSVRSDSLFLHVVLAGTLAVARADVTRLEVSTDGIALTQRQFAPFPAGAFFASHLDGSGSAFAWETGPLHLRSDCRG